MLAMLAIIIVAVVSVGFFTVKHTANAIDYVHDSGTAVEVLGPMSDGYKPGYAYYHTDPDYFDSLVWESSPQQADHSRANDDGTLGEIGVRWYMAHDDSGYGQKIAHLAIGQHVTIDGIEYVVDGRGLTTAGSPTDEIIEMTDNADVILMTCVEGNFSDEGHPEHVVWGHAVHSEQVTMKKRWE